MLTAGPANTFTLPDRGILLHVGPHKTGTTAIQAAFAAARPQLLEAGILYPGPKQEHNGPAAAAIQRKLSWTKDRIDVSRWVDLADLVRNEQSCRVVLSSEVFCEATAEAARHVIDDLGPARVHIAVTLRPLERLLPSSWQQYIKSGYTVSYDDWLADVLESRDKRPVTPSFWVRNNHPAMIRRWLDAVGDPDRVVVIVVDQKRPHSLFDAFEEILRLSPGFLDPESAGSANRSLTASECELLREVNVYVRSNKLASEDYLHLVKYGATRRLVASRVPDPDEAPITTPAWAIERAREFSASDVVEIGAMGVRVIGDLNTLTPHGSVPGTSAPAVSSVPVELAAAFVWDLLATATNRDVPGGQPETSTVQQAGTGRQPTRQVGARRMRRAAKRAMRWISDRRVGAEQNGS